MRFRLVFQQHRAVSIQHIGKHHLKKSVCLQSQIPHRHESPRAAAQRSQSDDPQTPIDLAHFGVLYLNNGTSFDTQIGKQIIPATWIQSSNTPPTRGSQNLFKEGFFQNLWWGATRTGRMQSDFYANGHFGQRIYISPDKRLVIVRLGSESGDVNWTEWLAGVADGGPRDDCREAMLED
jgi:hypothetical protein